MAYWASSSYQRLQFGVGGEEEFIAENQSIFYADAFLAAKEKKQSKKNEQKQYYNRLHKCQIVSYAEWQKAKSAVREKNRKKKKERKRK